MDAKELMDRDGLLEDLGAHLTKSQADKIMVAITKAEESGMDHDLVDAALEVFNKEVKNYGVESIEGNDQVDAYYYNINALYSNTGDTYAPTLIYDTMESEFIISSVGDLMESDPSRFDPEYHDDDDDDEEEEDDKEEDDDTFDDEDEIVGGGKISLADFIRNNQKEIDEGIRRVVPNIGDKLDNHERVQWVMNDEGLYNWAIQEGVDFGD